MKLFKLAIMASVAGMIGSTAAIAADPTFLELAQVAQGAHISPLVVLLLMVFQRRQAPVPVIRVDSVVCLV